MIAETNSPCSPRLVCLMALYNKEKTLAKAIDSVMMQQAPFRYKLIIIDDCSTDQSLTIARDYQSRYPDRIEIVEHAHNVGYLHTVAEGYKMLRGIDYFCLLDPDDWYIYDHKFADAVAYLDAHPSFSVYLAAVQWKQPQDPAMHYTGGGACEMF